MMDISKKLGKMEAENDYQNALMFGGIQSQDIMMKGGGSMDSSANLDLQMFDNESQPPVA